jgi:large subunit ribosomal protein L29
MKTSLLREQTDEELEQLLREQTREVHDLKAKKGIGDGSVQPLKVRTIRRELARLKTVIRERKQS